MTRRSRQLLQLAILATGLFLCVTVVARADCGGFPEVAFRAGDPAAAPLNGVWIGNWTFKDNEVVCAKLYVSVPDQRGIRKGEVDVVYCFEGIRASHTTPACSDKFAATLNGRTVSWKRFVDNGTMSFTLNSSGAMDGITGSTRLAVSPDVHGVFHRQ
ncbi:MAG: hypothetical protein ACREFC_15000 [Stellaceae bacterium]